MTDTYEHTRLYIVLRETDERRMLRGTRAEVLARFPEAGAALHDAHTTGFGHFGAFEVRTTASPEEIRAARGARRARFDERAHYRCLL